MTTLQKNYEGDIGANICDLIVSRLGVGNTQLAFDADLREDLGADSLDVAELVVTLGKLSKVTLFSQEVQYFRTLGDIRTVNQLLALSHATL